VNIILSESRSQCLFCASRNHKNLLCCRFRSHRHTFWSFRMFYGVPPGEDLRAKSESGPLFTLFGKGDKGRDRKSADHARMYGTCVYCITRVQRGVSIVH
jgi:hypothetical protein